MESEGIPRGKRLIYLLLMLVLVSLSLEGGLRLLGHNPWRPKPIRLQVEPGGTFYQLDPLLGYRHRAGQFHVTLNTGHSFTVTHGPDTLRVTRSTEEPYRTAHGREIWIFGCSFTHGWAVNDDETYPWLLQQKLSDHKVVNFGVTGYGTVHSFIQFREALAEGRVPELVVLGYLGSHEQRNTFARKRSKAIIPYNLLGPQRQPRALLDSSGHLHIDMAEHVYTEFPLMRHSAAIHLLERVFNEVEVRYLRSHDVSRALIKEIARRCAERNIPFVVLGLRTTDPRLGKMLDWCREQGIPTVNDAPLDYADEKYGVAGDFHPTPLAHRIIFRKLYSFLRDEHLVPMENSR